MTNRFFQDIQPGRSLKQELKDIKEFVSIYDSWLAWERLLVSNQIGKEMITVIFCLDQTNFKNILVVWTALRLKGLNMAMNVKYFL